MWKWVVLMPHPYASPTNLDKEVHIIHSKTGYNLSKPIRLDI